MWLMTTEGFYSAIRWHDGRICVRARSRADLTRLRKIVPTLSKIEVSLGRDYRYRCFCTPEEWQVGAAALAGRIDYGNFKSEVEKRHGFGSRYAHALHQVWSIMAKLQPAGPYGGNSDRGGYPPVPKGERKLTLPPSRWRDWATSAPTRFADKPLASRSIKAPADCDECGHKLEPDDAEWIGGRVYCKDMNACLVRQDATV